LHGTQARDYGGTTQSCQGLSRAWVQMLDAIEDFSRLDGNASTCMCRTRRLFLREGTRISRKVVLIEPRGVMLHL
jgi:hypothetical protein